MKRSIAFILILAGVFIIANRPNISSLNNLFSYSFCDQPIHYRVDTVDPKFNLSRETFLTDINQAAKIWDSTWGKDLFIYDPKGDLSINLIYDERQSLTSKINQLGNKVQSEKRVLNPQINEYQRLSADFKQKVTELNSQIEDWNSKGGAPPEEYKKLIQQQQDLQVQASNLNAMAKSLNISANEFNLQINDLNQTINTFNNSLEQRPEEGIFKGPENRIEIYFNTSKPELVHTLAHELGHALGMGHVDNPKAIMYVKTSQKLIPTDDDIATLKEVCKKHSIFEIIEVSYQRTFNLISAKLW